MSSTGKNAQEESSLLKNHNDQLNKQVAETNRELLKQQDEIKQMKTQLIEASKLVRERDQTIQKLQTDFTSISKSHDKVMHQEEEKAALRRTIEQMRETMRRDQEDYRRSERLLQEKLNRENRRRADAEQRIEELKRTIPDGNILFCSERENERL